MAGDGSTDLKQQLESEEQEDYNDGFKSGNGRIFGELQTPEKTLQRTHMRNLDHCLLHLD